MSGAEGAEGRRRAHDRHRLLVELARGRRPHDLGLDDAAGGVDGDIHRQFAVELAALGFGEVARAALLDAAAQRVVVQRIDGLARGRADVALLRARILVVDALLDLGQQLQQLAAALFLLAFLRVAGLAPRVGRRQRRDLAPDLRQQLLLLLLQVVDAAARIVGGVADLHRGRHRQRRGRAAPARPRRRRPGGPARWPAPAPAPRSLRALTRITSSGVSRKARLKRSGSTKRTVSTAPCTAAEASSAQCRVERSRQLHRWRAQAGLAAGSARGGAVVQVDGEGERARGLDLVLGAVLFGLGRRRPPVQARRQRGVQVQRQQVHAGDARAHPAAARQALGAGQAEDQRQRLGAHQAVLHHRGVDLGHALLLEPAQRPVALDALLEAVVGGVGGVEGRDDREQRRVLGPERRRQRRGAAVAGAGDDLPLVDQVDIAPQRRGRPGVLRHAHAGVRRRLGAHAHLDAGQHAGLAAVDAGHAVLGQPAAPGAVGQDHGLGDDQVQRRAAAARGDAHRLVAAGLDVVVDRAARRKL